MKRQYLGDSKDSFKWDYLHILVEALGYRRLKIAWVMSADDGGSEGRTAPEVFPARREILRLCHQLRAKRDPGLLFGLPATTGANYTVSVHDGGEADHANEAGSFSIRRLKPPASSRSALAEKMLVLEVSDGLQIWKPYGISN